MKEKKEILAEQSRRQLCGSFVNFDGRRRIIPEITVTEIAERATVIRTFYRAFSAKRMC